MFNFSGVGCQFIISCFFTLKKLNGLTATILEIGKLCTLSSCSVWDDGVSFVEEEDEDDEGDEERVEEHDRHACAEESEHTDDEEGGHTQHRPILCVVGAVGGEEVVFVAEEAEGLEGSEGHEETGTAVEEEEEEEVAEGVFANADVEPGAVVVHLGDTPVADRTVLGTGRAFDFADWTDFLLRVENIVVSKSLHVVSNILRCNPSGVGIAKICEGSDRSNLEEDCNKNLEYVDEWIGEIRQHCGEPSDNKSRREENVKNLNHMSFFIHNVVCDAGAGSFILLM